MNGESIHCQLVPKMLKSYFVKSFGKNICNMVMSAKITNKQRFILHLLTDKMKVYLHMFDD